MGSLPLDIDWQDGTLQSILWSIVALLFIYVLVRIGRRFAGRYVDDPARLYATSKLIGRVGGFMSLLLLIAIWSPGQNDLLTVLTVIGAGLALSMREALLSLVGWMNISLRVPYRQGDRIGVNGIRGDVIDIRLFHTTMMEIGGWVDADQSTGRLVHIPNNWIFLHGVYNYTRGFKFIWNEIPFTLTFRSDWQAAREILLSLAEESAAIVEQQAAREIRQMSREYLIHYSILTPFVYVKVVDNGVRLTLRYLCETRKRRGTEHALTMSALEAFQQQGRIELAYPMVGVAPFETPQFGPLAGPTRQTDGDARSLEQKPPREQAP